MIYYIADTHFGHNGAFLRSTLPFNSIDEMDNFIMDSWKATVTDGDIVYILGDFCYRSSKPAYWYLEQLPGEKHLIIGNHDKWVRSAARNLLASADYLKIISDQKRKVTLCHYPLAEWPHYFQKGYHVYGHIHNNVNRSNQFMEDEPMALNAGVMLNNYKPCTLDELIRNKQERRYIL